MRRKKYNSLQVILKIVERCNLACNYCYYFEGGDQSYKDKPPVISTNTARELAMFLSKGVDDLQISQIWISFHGGEPFLLKPKVLSEICEILVTEVGHKCDLVFTAQTNGTHLSTPLEDVIKKYRIRVSVSLDGLREEHDRQRKDHFGRGSFDRIHPNLISLKRLMRAEGLGDLEALSVLDARNNYRNLIGRMKNELGISQFNYLLPDCNHDDGIPNNLTDKDYGRALSEIVDTWAELGDIHVREIDKFLARFQLARKSDDSAEVRDDSYDEFCRNQIIVVRSDGEIQIDDTFIPASVWRNTLPKVRLTETSLRDYLALPVFQEIDNLVRNTPTACRTCTYKYVCNGGDLENRFSTHNGFDNPSVYCSGLKMFYRKLIKFLRRGGYPADIIRDRLQPDGGYHRHTYQL